MMVLDHYLYTVSAKETAKGTCANDSCVCPEPVLVNHCHLRVRRFKFVLKSVILQMFARSGQRDSAPPLPAVGERRHRILLASLPRTHERGAI